MEKGKGQKLRMLLEYSYGLKRYFVIAVFSSLFSTVFSLLVPQVVSVTVDSVIGSEGFSLPPVVLGFIENLGGRDFLRGHLFFCAGAIVIFAALSGVFNCLSRVNVATCTEGYIKRVRDALYRKTQRMLYSWHVKNQTGDIIQRCTADVDILRNFISGQLIEVVRTTILVVSSLTMMFMMNVRLALVAFAFIPVIGCYSIFFFGKIAAKFRLADEAEGDLLIKVQENLTGVRVVRAFGREADEMAEFDKKNNLFAKLWIDMGYVFGTYWGLGDVVTGVQLMSVVVAGTFLAVGGELTLGEMIVFVSYSQTLAWPVRHLGRVVSEMSKAGVSISRIREVLDAPEEEHEPNAVKPDLKADIEFKNVSFAYDEAEVLKNLNFKIEEGTTFGILGSTGSGKSTITYLLNRLYDLPDGSGEIKIGGANIKNIDREYLRRNVGLVLQEPFLFSKTVRENIEIAAREKNIERVRINAAVASIDDNILKFKDGYDTIVGERGVTLSGGEKQRVAIARTLMLEAPVMIFDDSLSAVDMETDAKIRDALRENTSGATVILISHRISTLMHADKIIVLENGEIKEKGSHEELMKQGGIYCRISRAQAGINEGGDVSL